MADSWRIEASAPGKLVLSGEYAVLAGAPALVAAVDRRVTCTLEPRATGGWRIVSRGFEGDLTLAKADVFRETSPTPLAGIVRRVIEKVAAPDHLAVTVDSAPCYLDGVKLGVGSSAATVTAVAAAFAAYAGESPGLKALYDIHSALHGGGSGLDVAAAVTGGVICFRQRRITPVRLPPMAKAFVFTGSGTRTADLLAKFERWRDGGSPPALERLADAAHAVADCTGNAETWIAALSEYADVLHRFDRISRIGVFGPGHRLARALATSCGVVYKPCGAGGGDTGVAVARDASAVATFVREVRATGLTVLAMEISFDGLTVRSG